MPIRITGEPGCQKQDDFNSDRGDWRQGSPGGGGWISMVTLLPGSSKKVVLLPYLKQSETESAHPSYRGITGYRLFRRPEALEADARNYRAIVASKEELDYNALDAVSSSPQPTFTGKVNAALQDVLIRSVSFASEPDRKIHFRANANTSQEIATIVALEKTRSISATRHP